MSDPRPSFEELLIVLRQLELRLQHLDHALELLAEVQEHLTTIQAAINIFPKF